MDIAVCDVLALIDMAICVTPQQRLLGRALYSHLFLLGLTERVSSIRHESRHLPQPRTPVIMGPGRSLSSGGAMRRPGGRDDVACVARSHRMHCLAFSFQTAAPRAAPSPRLRRESWGEGDSPHARTRGESPSPEAFGFDLSPQAGRGDERGCSARANADSIFKQPRPSLRANGSRECAPP